MAPPPRSRLLRPARPLQRPLLLQPRPPPGLRRPVRPRRRLRLRRRLLARRRRSSARRREARVVAGDSFDTDLFRCVYAGLWLLHAGSVV